MPSIPGPSTPAGDLNAYLRRVAAETLHMRLTQHIQHFYLPLPQAAPAHRPHALAHATSPRYPGIVETHIRPRWGTTRLVKISHEDVAESISNIRLAPASVAYIHRVVELAVRGGGSAGTLHTVRLAKTAMVPIPRGRVPAG